MLHRSRSHWFETALPYSPNEPLKESVNADICIIGGGVTGLSAAYHIRKLNPHASVRLLEAEVVGFGASGRNAGQLIVAFGENDFRAQLKRYGREKLSEAYAYVSQGLGMIEELIQEHGIDCDYDQTGYLEMGMRSEGESLVEDYVKFLKLIDQGRYVESLSAAQVASEFDSPYFSNACFDRRGGQLNPLKLVRGFKSVAEKLGAVIYENSPVIGIQRTFDGITVQTGAGAVNCAKLVLATNAYSHLINGLDDLGTRRVQSPVFVYANITETLSSIQWARLKWWRRCGVNMMSKMFYSFAPTSDGRLLYVGNYYAGVPSGNDMALDISKGFMLDGSKHLSAFFPALSDVRTVQSWGGPISTTRDYIPHVGLLEDSRIGYANGCWGHGIPIGTRHGLTLAELMLEGFTESTTSWLVMRDKLSWPTRCVTSMVVKGLSAVMRHDIRKAGLKMDPQLTFTE
ncbi:TPA: NAD(P)/FAD-dependent oxidoreductase [Pseudomonas aeruginosa]